MLTLLEIVLVVTVLGMVGGLFRGGRGRLLFAVPASVAAVGVFVAAARVLIPASTNADILAQVPQSIEDESFVTSTTCRACHPDQYESWHDTYHRTMTQVAAPHSVLAPFDGVEMEIYGHPIRLERRGDEFWVDMVDPLWETQLLAKKRDPTVEPNPRRIQAPVVLTTGSHRLQAYWIQGDEGVFYQLPIVWFVEANRWVPNWATFLQKEPKKPPAHNELNMWNFNCIRCHAVAGEPHWGRKRGVPTESKTAELGISCEACHGPAEEHVSRHQNPLTRYAARASDQVDPSIVLPTAVDSKTSTQICGQCHAFHDKQEAGFLKHGYDFRAGEDLTESRYLVRRVGEPDARLQRVLDVHPGYLDKRFWSDGTYMVGGREYNGLFESACYQEGELSCTSCHSMHAADPNQQIKPEMETNAACVSCHEPFESDAALEAHTHHASDSSGSLCYNCHMPRTTYALLSATRTHRIDLPKVETGTALDRPNACNLCHLDKTIGWAAEQMEAWYGTPNQVAGDDETTYAAGPMWMLKGNAVQRALATWHLGSDEGKEASGVGWQAPFLIDAMDDRYAVTRYMAGRSLRSQPGFEDVEFDYVAPKPLRDDVRKSLLEEWILRRGSLKPGPNGSVTSARPEMLFGPAGIDASAFEALRARRDDQPMSISE